jgi:hypothetical protein
MLVLPTSNARRVVTLRRSQKAGDLCQYEEAPCQDQHMESNRLPMPALEQKSNPLKTGGTLVLWLLHLMAQVPYLR